MAIKKLESDVQKEILKYLNKNTYCFKTIVTNSKGVSDIVGCVNGQFFAFEVKAIGGRATKLQLLHLQNIRVNGGIGEVVSSLSDVKEIIEPLLKPQSFR